jgi:hypothetical protein
MVTLALRELMVLKRRSRCYVPVLSSMRFRWGSQLLLVRVECMPSLHNTRAFYQQHYCTIFISVPTPVPTNKPTTANTSNEMPSSRPSFRRDVDVQFPPTERKPLGPNKRAFIGVSVAAILLLTTAGGALALRSVYFDKKAVPDGYYSEAANNYVPWERYPPFPFSVLSSSSSSSSSFRDCRFVRLRGPSGESIAQFDPNTASAGKKESMFYPRRILPYY